MTFIILIEIKDPTHRFEMSSTIEEPVGLSTPLTRERAPPDKLDDRHKESLPMIMHVSR